MKRIDWKKLGRTVVFIDAANLEKSVKDLGWWIDYRRLHNFFRKQTTLVEIRYYSAGFGSQRHDEFLAVLKKIGIELTTKPLKVIKGAGKDFVKKANFDVEIALDAVKMISSYNSLLLFSGDSDFEFLVRELRQRGKLVWVISSRGHVSIELVRAASRYIPLSVLKEFFVRKKSPRRSGGS